MNKLLLKVIIVLLVSIPLFGQENIDFKIHSHNDYKRDVPFWEAFANKVASIEIDVILKNDTLFVAHERGSLSPKKTMEDLYLNSIENAYTLYDEGRCNIQLVVDLKSEPYSTLEQLIVLLKKYKHLLKTPEKKGISVIISGNRPAPIDYVNYPDFITFDSSSLEKLSNESWNKVSLISLNFKKFSKWNGKGKLIAEDYKKVSEVINKAHSLGKPFRFWGNPDSKTTWKTFADMEVDFINTDKPFESTQYLKSLKSRVFHNELKSVVYVPTFKSDKKNRSVKNIILLIGDGNGLSQISSATLANGGQLTMTQLKSVGFLKTQSADDFTTDSAAGGTALATGKKSYNRAIGVDVNGQSIENITEILAKHNFVSGLITTDKITGATPASFYAHQKDRSDIKEIAEDLPKSKLSLFIGGGGYSFQDHFISTDFTILKRLDQLRKSNKDKVGIFISENGVPGILQGRGNILAEATKNGLKFLHAKKKPFFLMIEGAQIDSYGHSNNVGGIISEGIDFDRAVTEAIKFADRTKNTLVIVTADHETSGFSIPHGNVKNGIIEGDFITHDHTGVMVPIFAYGPHSQEFQGVYEISDVIGKILKILKINQ